ncbi:hypothetical protein V1264_002626 [Littorina saxatilis]|uniref:Uncharacterized protein n=1 Tax=Littorina saxatilis TaxID=31220 RepID=A0AAN9B450_9CAEN
MAAPQQNPTINWQATNLNEEWKNFKDHAQLMFKGPLKRIGEEEQCAYLLIWVGDTGREFFNSWGLADADKKNISFLVGKFQDHAAPTKKHNFRTLHLPGEKTAGRRNVRNFRHGSPQSGERL